ncbi:competence type IV pilus major pilin ComGC [Streptococcus sp. DD13]|uniref:competence type IV pilus major pilin ComGC n=1 Tax=Streptococcus sp. DD13 TaxID=1777881 RepID=UPI000796F6BD|nr:competence type IV pilus major pilin ComGC [Streptococcus sp. DD13]KXT77913.1 Late competence protein ComGC, access of DNA to ComEA [Streptococcus sp. DD13]
MEKLKRKYVSAFTLIEMLIVLLIISVLLLLFVPNLSNQKENVKETGNAAIVKVVEGQAELYEMSHTDTASLQKLVSQGMITKEQSSAYQEYYAKHSDQTANIGN